jgi:alkanesulfonate monooxygenase SsuD/methylene tetrahydromethanopterin reductase-like flavin-dependent oxidoreductase (luciferase family)
LDRQQKHDDRYEVADEYMEVCYKLWEGSWEEDAVVRNSAKRLFSDPGKVHEILHYGKYFTVPGYHLCEPSPQRTPVLYQAGASRRGKDFAARNAECVFVAAPSKKVLKEYVRDIRQRAASFGRDPASLLFFNLFTVIVAPTESEAKAKHDEYRKYVSYDGALALVSGWTGIDFGKYHPDDRIEYIENDAVQSATESLTTSDPMDLIWPMRSPTNRFATSLIWLSPSFSAGVSTRRSTVQEPCGRSYLVGAPICMKSIRVLPIGSAKSKGR